MKMRAAHARGRWALEPEGISGRRGPGRARLSPFVAHGVRVVHRHPQHFVIQQQLPKYLHMRKLSEADQGGAMFEPRTLI